MTTQIKIENLSATRQVIVEPFDMAGDPPEPVSAGAIGILPGQAATVTVHDLRSLQVYEGEPSGRPVVAADAAEEAPTDADAGTTADATATAADAA